MDAKETIKALLEASEDGMITAEQVTQAGLHRSVLQELVKSGELYRFGRGLYVRSGIWEDELYLLQRKYGRRPSQNLCKPPMWCRIEAPHWRFL